MKFKGLNARCLLSGIAGFALATTISAVALSAYGDYSARASLSKTMVAALPLRAAVEAELQKAVGSGGRTIGPSGLVGRHSIAGADYLRVLDDGTMIFRNAEFGQVIVFEPAAEGGLVTWRCVSSGLGKDRARACE